MGRRARGGSTFTNGRASCWRQSRGCPGRGRGESRIANCKLNSAKCKLGKDAKAPPGGGGMGGGAVCAGDCGGGGVAAVPDRGGRGAQHRALRGVFEIGE